MTPNSAQAVDPCAPWNQLTIGNDTPAGNCDYNPATGAFTITADGGDIWGNNDDFHFVYQPLEDRDCTIIARVATSFSGGTNEWKKAGVMIRETLAHDCRAVWEAISDGGGGGETLQWRNNPGGGCGSSHINSGITPPEWVKLVRKGDSFEGWFAPDTGGGTHGAWTQEGGDGYTHTTVMDNRACWWGLCVTSHQAGTLTTITIDNVSILYEQKATRPDPPDGNPVNPATFVELGWTEGYYAATHNIYFGTNPAAFPPPATQSLGDETYDPGPLDYATRYYWRVDEVNDNPGAPPGSPWTGDLWSFRTVRESGMGSATLNLYFDIPTVDISALYNHPNYPDNPSDTSLVPMFEGPTSETDTYENYGGRMHGWLMPELSGDYTFFMASDDDGELYLSPDMVPHHAELIAYEYGVTGWRNWQTTGTQTSLPIPLVGGQLYYISGMWKEASGGDYLAVAWQGPDQPDAPVGGSPDQIISGYYLWPFTQFWAHNPDPEDGALIDGEIWIMPPYEIYAVMEFDPGYDAVAHEGFFSEYFEDVNGRDPNASLGPPPFPATYPTRYYAGWGMVPPYTDTLERGKTYYWCVDETDSLSQVWEGPVWSLSIRHDSSWDHNPVDGTKLVSLTPTLSWKAGAEAGHILYPFHDIYLGTNFNDVNNAEPNSTDWPEYMGTQPFGDETWEPNADGGLTLDYGTDYYWRIDEVHGRNLPAVPGEIITGEVLTFTTIPYIPITDPNQVGWWRFDEDNDPLVIDWSGYDRYGHLRGDPAWTPMGKISGAMYFDGAGDYVNIDGYKGIQGANPLTVAAWIRKVTTGAHSIVTWGTNADGQRFGFRLDNTVLRFEFGGGNVVANTLVTDGEWHHVAMTVPRNGLLGGVILYVDGVDDLGVANNPTNPFNLGNATDVRIGSRATHNDRFFNGLIDNVRIYDRELTAGEIAGTMIGDPAIAYDPDPENWADVNVEDVNLLSWSPGAGALTHTVYFGTSLSDVNESATPVSTGQSEPNFDPGVLQLDTTYYWRVDEVSGATATGNIWRFNVMRPGRGLVADYYHWIGGSPPSREAAFAGDPVLTRIDPQINFDWDTTSSPDPSINIDHFSARWNGAIEPEVSEPYTFYTGSDDGVRLWVDGQLIIDNWTDHSPTIDASAAIELTAGEAYRIRMEYYENGGGAVAHLLWQHPSMPVPHIIPERVLSLPLWAYNPSPADGDFLVDPTEVDGFSWSPGMHAETHDLYFGTSLSDVNESATPVSPGQDANSYPIVFDFNETYYWRVDEVNTTGPVTGVWTGEIWTFGTVRAAGLGSILMERWLGITGTDLNILKNDPRYPDHPDESSEIRSFDSQAGLGDNYGGKIHGWLVPQTTGDYRFWITTDDQGELWLNDDPDTGMDPSGAELIAFMKDAPHDTSGTGWAGPYQWWPAANRNHPEADSNNVVGGLIHLEANKKYYICALWKEGGGGDHCMVAWQGPDQPDAPVDGSGDAVIDGWFLMPFTRLWASNPNPPHERELSAEEVTLLSWRAGIEAATHNVYFGTHLSDVNESATAVASGLALDVNYYDPGPIEWETTYYWRIDEVNGTNVWTGGIWWFRAGNYAFPEDFESYAKTDPIQGIEEPNALRYVWKDGFSFWVAYPGHGKSGSNIMRAGPDDWPRPYLHRDDYYTGFYGTKAMALYYDNDGVTQVPGFPGTDSRDPFTYTPPLYSEVEAATTGVDGLELGLDWTRKDIKALSLWFKGNPTGRRGSFYVDTPIGGAYTIQAAGADIWDEPAGQPPPFHDEFHYAWQSLKGYGGYDGCCTVTVRVDSVENTNAWAKAGVMIRDTLHIDANHASVVVTPGQGVSLQYRDVKRGASTHFTQGGITAPHWVRLTRDEWGDFTAEHANDVGGYPDIWSYINRDETQSVVDTVYMDPNVYVGLALTSHNVNQLGTAVFSGLLFEPDTHSAVLGPWRSQDIGIISNDIEDLYLAIEDTSSNVGVVYYKDEPNAEPNEALVTTWTPWDIDLANPSFASVDLEFVDRVYIGLGDRDTPTLGGSGVMYFDDIRLYRARFIRFYYDPMLANLNADALVDEKDLQIMADYWLYSDDCIYPESPSDANLLVYWAFNEGIGEIANDSTINGNDGEIDGAVWDEPGYDGLSYCLEFFGGTSTDEVNDVDAGAYLNGLDAITVSIWVNSDVVGADAGFIIFEDPAGNDNRGMRYDAAGATGGEPNVIKIGITSTAGTQQLESSVNVQTTDWQHLVMTWSSGNQLALYIDGLLDTPSANDAAATGTTTGATKLLVGRAGKDQTSSWDGLIDDVRIYDYALSYGEVRGMDGLPYLHIPMDPAALIADIYFEEPECYRWINFKDFAKLAEKWLELEDLFPR